MKLPWSRCEYCMKKQPFLSLIPYLNRIREIMICFDCYRKVKLICPNCNRGKAHTSIYGAKPQ